MREREGLRDHARCSSTVGLSVIIVSWNVCGLLRRCLQSVLEPAIPCPGAAGLWQIALSDSDRRTCEVLVIDSASSDGSVSMVRESFPGVQLYASDVNLGYTGGNNLGMQESRGRYVLLLNADTEVLDGALGAMVTYMEEHPQVGVLGPQLLWPDGTVQSSRRRFPTLHTALVDSTFLEKWCPRHPVLRRYKMLDLPDRSAAQVDWVVGACLLVRRQVIDQVGLLDDGYFMYSEELDWQKRISRAGWAIVYMPEAQVVHHHGKSSGQVGALTHIRFSRSKVRYFCRHHGPLAGHIVRIWLFVNYAYEWAMEALKWCLGSKRHLRRERMCAYAQVLRSGLRGEPGCR